MNRKWLLALAAPLILSLAACGGGSKSSDSGGSSSPAASSSGNKSSSANDEITSLFSNFSKVKSFRATVTIAGGTTTQEAKAEFVQPDRMHMTMSSGSIGSIELISIGNDSYTKIGTTWTKSAVPGGSPLDTKSFSDGFQQASTDTSIVKGGTDTVNGKKCQIYTRTISGGTQEYCVADGLPLRSVTKTGTSTITAIFTDYNANIDIKAPI